MGLIREVFQKKTGVDPENIVVPSISLAPPAPPAAPTIEDTAITLRKKELAIELVREWSVRMLPHRMAIDSAMPRSVMWVEKRPGMADKNWARDVYEATAEGKNPADLELRNHVIQLLNFLEMVATAYRHNAVDRAMLEEEFRNLMLRWYLLLEPFLIHASENFGDGQMPWEPLVLLVDIHWRREPHNFAGENVPPV
jgi:hypothetical protein